MANVDYAYPLDSIVNYDGNGVPSFDRAVSSLVLRRLYSYLFTNGVWLATDSTALQVGVSEGMKVSVNAGFTVINGALRLFAEPRTLAIQASENEDRIDTVVARLDLNQNVRNIDLYVLKGVSGSTPVRPELTRNDSVYELGLADLYITKNTTSISADRITDTRLDTQRCGVVSSISEFDTTTLYNQIQADLAHFKSENEADFEAWSNGQESTFATWSSTQRSAFETWFAGIRDILDGDVAGHLQNEIDGLSSSKANKSDITNINITGTTNNTGSNIFAGTRFYLNGELCIATQLIPVGATFTSSNFQQVPINRGKVYIKLSTGDVPSTTDFSVSLSVTIPANCEFALYGIGSYSNSPCEGAKFRESNPNTNWGETASTGNRVSISGVNYDKDTTFYLLTKYGDTSKNNKQIHGWYKYIDYNVV